MCSCISVKLVERLHVILQLNKHKSETTLNFVWNIFFRNEHFAKYNNYALLSRTTGYLLTVS
jgi:hypothetical protein